MDEAWAELIKREYFIAEFTLELSLTILHSNGNKDIEKRD
jgi:hypothetical protein